MQINQQRVVLFCASVNQLAMTSANSGILGDPWTLFILSLDKFIWKIFLPHPLPGALPIHSLFFSKPQFGSFGTEFTVFVKSKLWLLTQQALECEEVVMTEWDQLLVLQIFCWSWEK